MKRIFCAFLTVMMLIGCACADGFMTPNGVTFGMTVDEVTKAEKVTNWDYYEESDSFFEHYKLPDKITTASGLSVQVSYYFDTDGRLVTIHYTFPVFDKASSPANDLVSSLKQTYGDYGDSIYLFSGNKPTSYGMYKRLQSSGMSGAMMCGPIRTHVQWIHTFDEGDGIEIMLLESGLLGSNSYFMIELTYTYRDASEIKSLNKIK